MYFASPKHIFKIKPEMELPNIDLIYSSSNTNSMLHCPSCGNEYKCPCKYCKGKNWKYMKKGELIKCLKCGFTETSDWWFDLDLKIHNQIKWK